jgi:hypothetical protein
MRIAGMPEDIALQGAHRAILEIRTPEHSGYFEAFQRTTHFRHQDFQ